MKTILVALVLVMTSSAFGQAGEPLTGKLKLKVSPGRAGIFIDGKYIGPAANFKRSRTYKLTVGEHEVTLVDPRYEELKTKVNIHAGETISLSEHLRELPEPIGPFGTIRIQKFDKYAAVFLNGKFYGHADEVSNFAQGLLIKPGDYLVRVEPTDGSAAHEEKVTVVEGKSVTVRGR